MGRADADSPLKDDCVRVPSDRPCNAIASYRTVPSWSTCNARVVPAPDYKGQFTISSSDTTVD